MVAARRALDLMSEALKAAAVAAAVGRRSRMTLDRREVVRRLLG